VVWLIGELDFVERGGLILGPVLLCICLDAVFCDRSCKDNYMNRRVTSHHSPVGVSNVPPMCG